LNESDAIKQFHHLFKGRPDALGTWDGPGSGIARGPHAYADTVDHLCSPAGKRWIGVYPHLGTSIDGHSHVTWGCIDVDGKDFDHDFPKMWGLANTLRIMLEIKNVFGHIEQTRNGYHLWVFPEGGKANAAHMRRALMAACKAVNYDPKEVNPKSETLETGKIGNYVRLPYHGYLSDTTQHERKFCDGYDDLYGLEEWLTLKLRYTALDALETVAALWTPPPVATFDGPVPDNIQALLTAVRGLTYSIWRDGPLEGRDRSNTLAKLGYNLKEDGMSMPAAFSIVKDADTRWGKFFGREDCDEQIMGIIERCYSHA